VKTGGCPEDCGYCARASTSRPASRLKLMDAETVIAAAAEAKAGGAQRFCMGAAWRDLKDRDLPKVAAMISGVKALGWRPAPPWAC
jgi:biotin synthase